MITVKGYELKNSSEEMTIGEFEKVVEITTAPVFNPNKPDEPHEYETAYEQWKAVFMLQGLPEEVYNTMSYDEMNQAIQDFNAIRNDELRTVKSFELDGFRYAAFDEKFLLTVRDATEIERICKRHPRRHIAEMMAVLFKREDLSDAEHYAPAHIKHKAKLFRDQVTAVIAIPYLAILAQKIAVSAKATAEAAKKAEEESEVTEEL